MRIIHYIKVAMHFWPWERCFWLGLCHDLKEDGYWWLCKYFPERFRLDIDTLSRQTRVPYKFGSTYNDYIIHINLTGGDVKRVKIADLLENYRRAKPITLRKRYAKALLELAK